MGQSTNDVYPTATRLAILFVLQGSAGGVARACRTASRQKSREFAAILKTGRTHLQDAVPITLGQEFGGYAANVAHAAGDLERTAVAAARAEPRRDGGRHRPERRRRLHAEAIANLARYTALPLRRAEPSSASRRAWATSSPTQARSGGWPSRWRKVASDLRLLSMGPRAGIAEIQLPAVQPGSSIMPGKVNPSVPEMVNQVCCQVFGCDAAILAAADAGQLELNVMMPVIAWNALHATTILGQAMRVLRCDVRGAASRPTTSAARELLDRSTALATALSPHIGYAQTAEIAKLAVEDRALDSRIWCASGG